MRLQDLTISQNNNGGGIYYQIDSYEDYHKFLELCKIFHQAAHMYSISSTSEWSPTRKNIDAYLKHGCYAYISSVTGVVGVSSKRNLASLGGYQKRTLGNKVILHNLVKNYKE